jgi:hypothetical protein
MVQITILIIGIPFGAIAAVMAFIITYEEYRHHYKDLKTPIRHGVETALVTFLFFVVMSLLLSCLYTYFR